MSSITALINDISTQRHNKYELTVEIRGAKNLEDKTLMGSHSVYVAVDVLKETKHTKKIADVVNPKWNESLIFQLHEIPQEINIRVRDDRMLLPNLTLGSYKIHIKERLLSPNTLIPITLEIGEIKLLDSPNGYLDLSAALREHSVPCAIDQSVTDKQQINNLVTETTVNNAKQEYHVLPTIHVEEAPTIIEKEVIYIKPVEIYQTIIEKELPKIVEIPTIHETKENYVEPTKYIRNENTTTIEKQNDIKENEQMFEDLRKQREEAFSNHTPIIEHETQQIYLPTQIEQIPTEIITKNVIYEQPIEIERNEIEKVKPTIIENVVHATENIMEKEKPQVITKDPIVLNNQ